MFSGIPVPALLLSDNKSSLYFLRLQLGKGSSCRECWEQTQTQPHFSGPSRIYRETDTRIDENKSRQRPRNTHTNARETALPPQD